MYLGQSKFFASSAKWLFVGHLMKPIRDYNLKNYTMQKSGNIVHMYSFSKYFHLYNKMSDMQKSSEIVHRYSTVAEVFSFIQ